MAEKTSNIPFAPAITEIRGQQEASGGSNVLRSDIKPSFPPETTKQLSDFQWTFTFYPAAIAFSLTIFNIIRGIVTKTPITIFDGTSKAVYLITSGFVAFAASKLNSQLSLARSQKEDRDEISRLQLNLQQIMAEKQNMETENATMRTQIATKDRETQAAQQQQQEALNAQGKLEELLKEATKLIEQLQTEKTSAEQNFSNQFSQKETELQDAMTGQEALKKLLNTTSQKFSDQFKDENTLRMALELEVSQLRAILLSLQTESKQTTSSSQEHTNTPHSNSTELQQEGNKKDSSHIAPKGIPIQLNTPHSSRDPSQDSRSAKINDSLLPNPPHSNPAAVSTTSQPTHPTLPSLSQTPLHTPHPPSGSPSRKVTPASSRNPSQDGRSAPSTSANAAPVVDKQPTPPQKQPTPTNLNNIPTG